MYTIFLFEASSYTTKAINESNTVNMTGTIIRKKIIKAISPSVSINSPTRYDPYARGAPSSR